MVRGLLFKLEFPYAHFGTEGVTADVLYPIVWEAVRLLEADGVKVLCVTADGASPNGKFSRCTKLLTCLYLTRLGIPMRRMSVGFSLSQIRHILLRLFVIVGHILVFLALNTWRSEK